MRERMQDKSFKAWINLQLQRDKLTVTVRVSASWWRATLARGHARGAQADHPVSRMPIPPPITILLRT